MSRLIAASLALLTAGCATYGPTWSEISGDRFTVTTLNRRPAIIERVDDTAAFAQYPIKVEPGRREIVMQGPTLRWPGGTALHTMTLDLEPCKRYYLNAQFDNPVQPNWNPVVDYVDTIAGCKVAAATK